MAGTGNATTPGAPTGDQVEARHWPDFAPTASQPRLASPCRREAHRTGPRQSRAAARRARASLPRPPVPRRASPRTGRSGSALPEAAPRPRAAAPTRSVRAPTGRLCHPEARETRPSPPRSSRPTRCRQSRALGAARTRWSGPRCPNRGFRRWSATASTGCSRSDPASAPGGRRGCSPPNDRRSVAR